MKEILAYEGLRVRILTGVNKGAVGSVQIIHLDNEKPLQVHIPNGVRQKYKPDQVEIIDRDREKYLDALYRLPDGTNPVLQMIDDPAKTDREKVNWLKDKKVPVDLYFNNETGEDMWAIRVSGTDFWLGAYREKKRATEECAKYELPILAIDGNSDRMD